MPLLVLIYLAIKIVVVKVQFLISTFRGLCLVFGILVIVVFGQDGLVDDFIPEHACETQGVNVFIQ